MGMEHKAKANEEHTFERQVEDTITIRPRMSSRKEVELPRRNRGLNIDLYRDIVRAKSSSRGFSQLWYMPTLRLLNYLETIR